MQHALHKEARDKTNLNSICSGGACGGEGVQILASRIKQQSQCCTPTGPATEMLSQQYHESFGSWRAAADC